jgi:hypothetical protein
MNVDRRFASRAFSSAGAGAAGLGLILALSSSGGATPSAPARILVVPQSAASGLGAFDSTLGFATNKGTAFSGSDSFIGAGDLNDLAGTEAFLGSGVSNFIAAEGTSAVIGGGTGNVASGPFAAIGGGSDNRANGKLSTIANQFLARASGGVKLVPGSGTWSSLSDRAMKSHVVAPDDAAILGKVATLPVSEWSYTSESGVRHVGPMAQDFYATFGVGEDDRHIMSIDEDGVALSAIEALHRENVALRAGMLSQHAELVALRGEIRELEATFASTRSR